MAGVNLDTLRPLLGHKDRKTTDRYTTIDMRIAGKAVDSLPTIGEINDKKTASTG